MTSLEELTLEGWDFSNVTNMGNFIYGCSNLKTLNIINYKGLYIKFDSAITTTMSSITNVNLTGTSLDIDFLKEACCWMESLVTLNLTNANIESYYTNSDAFNINKSYTLILTGSNIAKYADYLRNNSKWFSGKSIVV